MPPGAFPTVLSYVSALGTWYVKRNFPKNSSALYISLDNIRFSEHRLIELIDGFVKKGGKYLFADDVHKYPNWSQELKNAYDDYPELQIVFTGSSLLEILNASADLSRRAVVYQMQGLSFREYLNMSLHENFPVYSLQDMLENHRDISSEILKSVKPLQYSTFHLVLCPICEMFTIPSFRYYNGSRLRCLVFA